MQLALNYVINRRGMRGNLRNRDISERGCGTELSACGTGVQRREMRDITAKSVVLIGRKFHSMSLISTPLTRDGVEDESSAR